MTIYSRESTADGGKQVPDYNLPPRVLIVGAGLAGLLLAILLEHSNTPYKIFERAAEVKPIGAIGIYEELLNVSFPILEVTLYNESLKQVMKNGPMNNKELVGYDYLVFPRPALYDLLLAKIPKEKIVFKKKVRKTEQSFEGVSVHCSDNTIYDGDILVGADGAYSAVRQNLYKQLAQENKLPFADAEQMNVNFTTMVGTTGPLDPNVFPLVTGESSTQSFMFGKSTSYTWCTFTVPGNRICWHIMKQLDTQAADDESFRNSEWTPEANEAIIRDAANFKTPHGTIGSLIEQTPKELISRVFLEDKLFETWYHGRVVLIGDACHKLLPSAGQGAVNAMQDAVILANCLYDMTSIHPRNITTAFKDYREQRHQHVVSQYETSKLNAKLMYGQTWSEKLLRFTVFNLLPRTFMEKGLLKEGAYRPQVTFMPRIPDRGRGASLPQKPSRRYTEEQQAKLPVTI